MTALTPGDALEPQEFTVTRADLVRYAEASGDHNPIHQDEEVAALGRAARRHRPRHVHAGAGGPRRRRTGPAAPRSSTSGCKFTNPVVVPADGGATVVVAGTVKSVDDGLVTLALEVTCEGQKVLGMPKAVVRA